MSEPHKIELGMEVRDCISDFKGIVVGVVRYITGCDQAEVIPTVDKDGKKPDGHWIDVSRLIPTGKVVVLPNSVWVDEDAPAVQPAAATTAGRRRAARPGFSTDAAPPSRG